VVWLFQDHHAERRRVRVDLAAEFSVLCDRLLDGLLVPERTLFGLDLGNQRRCRFALVALLGDARPLEARVLQPLGQRELGRWQHGHVIFPVGCVAHGSPLLASKSARPFRRMVK
jgi:hypothetical protein